MKNWAARQKCGLVVPAVLGLLFLVSACRGKGENALAEQLLGIEKQVPVAQLRERGLNGAEEQRLRDLLKQLRRLDRDIQRPLLQRSRYANHNQAIALIFMNYGMYADARQYLDQAIAQQGNNAALFYYRGLSSGWLMKNSIDVRAREGYLEQARRDYERSLEIQPGYTDSLYGLAVLKLFEEQDFAAAAGLLDRYIAQRNIAQKNVNNAKNSLGSSSVGKAKTLREAQRRAKKAHSPSKSQDVNALFLRAQAAYGLGRLNEAASFYDWAAGAAVSVEMRNRAEQLKNEVLRQNNYRSTAQQ